MECLPALSDRAARTGTGTADGPAGPSGPRGPGQAVRGAPALVFLAALAVAAPAVAQTTTLVSNIEQTRASTSTFQQAAQPFTTGDNVGGYSLTNVEIKLGRKLQQLISPNAILVRIAPNGTSNVPDLSNADNIITLITPALITTGTDNAFTAPAGTTLAANTIYHVVVTSADSTKIPQYGLRRTTLTSEDTTSASGWSIADNFFLRGGSSDSWTSSNANSVLIRINGRVADSANTAPTASNSTVTTTEDTGYAFSAANFNFSDDDTGDTLSIVTVVTLPTVGTLTVADMAVRENQIVPAVDLG